MIVFVLTHLLMALLLGAVPGALLTFGANLLTRSKGEDTKDKQLIDSRSIVVCVILSVLLSGLVSVGWSLSSVPAQFLFVVLATVVGANIDAALLALAIQKKALSFALAVSLPVSVIVFYLVINGMQAIGYSPTWI